jgi:hypothetical protein
MRRLRRLGIQAPATNNEKSDESSTDPNDSAVPTTSQVSPETNSLNNNVTVESVNSDPNKNQVSQSKFL